MQLPTMIRSRFRFAGDLARAADVAKVLAKYGLAASLTDINWEPLNNALKSHGGDVLAHQSFEVRIRLALTDLGTTFVKLGQMLSTRPQLVGEALAGELKKLQQNTPADSPEVALKVLEAELGRPVADIFRHFEGVALASASIGQVHHARLKSGRRAIVKIQHPGIEGVIRQDLDILAFLADLAENNAWLRRYQPAALIREFSRATLNELDFRRELRNLQTFRRNFSEDQTVSFPKPYPELTSGRVMTMEFMQGFSVTDAHHLDKLEISRQDLATRGANVFIQMIFRDGFYHADPHPGNFLVMPDGKIGLLDAGMVGRIDDTFRTQIEDILLAAGERDAERLCDAVTKVCGSPRDLDRSRLSQDLTEFFEEFSTQAVGQFNMSGALDGITSIIHEHGLIMPGRLSMLIKCLILLEGTGSLLSPAFNLVELLQPWRKTILMRRFSPRARLKSLRHLYTDWHRMLESVPKAAVDIIDRFEAGRFSIKLEHRQLTVVANRLVAGLFISSLLLASAILIATKVPPTAWGISVFGFLGFLGAIVLGLSMLWANRENFMRFKKQDWD
jgi:ubiquinone biosynthesis protein